MYLLIFAFVMGGAGAQASVILNSPSGGYLVCVNSTTKVVTHPGTTTCPKGSKRLVLGAQGAAGPAGPAGAAGAAGPAGATGATGPAGVSAPVAPSTDCIGTKCSYKIGDTGPGGGIVFFVDYNNQYSGFDYLEVAPQGWGNGIPAEPIDEETAGTATDDPKMKWCSDNLTLLNLNSWQNRAPGAGESNTTTAISTCEGGAIKAARDYRGGSKTDWSLGSLGEMKLLYDNLQGLGGFMKGDYFSSSEAPEGSSGVFVWVAKFSEGFQYDGYKQFTYYVRPVRAF